MEAEHPRWEAEMPGEGVKRLGVGGGLLQTGPEQGRGAGEEAWGLAERQGRAWEYPSQWPFSILLLSPAPHLCTSQLPENSFIKKETSTLFHKLSLN